MQTSEYNQEPERQVGKSLSKSTLKEALSKMAIAGIIAGVSAAATSCTNEVVDEGSTQEMSETTNETKSAVYPDIMVGIDNEESLQKVSFGIFNADTDYTFTLTSIDNPADTIVFTTEVDDRGYFSAKHQFQNPTSGFNVTAVTVGENPITVQIQTPCEGEKDACILGNQAYPPDFSK